MQGAQADRIAGLDTTIFEAVPSATTKNDRQSMLAIQSAIALKRGSFTYLEIGSDLGGSIQPYLLDGRCLKIISIDKRPKEQPDARGKSYTYPRNSTARMMENLARLSSEAGSKIQTFEADSSELTPAMLLCRPDVCFIDGEHTDAAVKQDFTFCEMVATRPGVIYFHDSGVVFHGLTEIVQSLKSAGRPFHAYNLPDSIFVIDFGLNIHEAPGIQGLLLDNYVGYLAGLENMASYRMFYNGWFARKLRSIYGIGGIRQLARAVRTMAGGSSAGR